MDKTNCEQLTSTAYCSAIHWYLIQLKDILPEEYDILAQFTECLPNGATSPTYPFSGLVLNFNVSTSVHRDTKDQSVCLVMPLFDSSTSGGHLCIKELGLVIEMKSMDFVIFRSSKLMHFNLHYIGKRTSLVLHSDSAGAKWVQDRNGWVDNIFMRAD